MSLQKKSEVREDGVGKGSQKKGNLSVNLDTMEVTHKFDTDANVNMVLSSNKKAVLSPAEESAESGKKILLALLMITLVGCVIGAVVAVVSGEEDSKNSKTDFLLGRFQCFKPCFYRIYHVLDPLVKLFFQPIILWKASQERNLRKPPLLLSPEKLAVQVLW